MLKKEENNYEEYNELSLGWTWFIVVALCLFLIGTGLFAHRMLPDTPRRWNFGTVDMIPAESVYSTSPVAPVAVAPNEINKIPQQLEPLPGSLPLEKLPPRGYEQGVGMP